MKQKIHFFDLAVIAVWTIFILCGRREWGRPDVLLLACAALLRLVLSFSLYRKERRSWMPLLAYAACCVLIFASGMDDGITGIAPYAFNLLGVEQDIYVNIAIRLILICWIVVAPFFYYVALLCRHKLVRTKMTWNDLAGAVMWNDRNAKYYSAVLAITLIAALTGKAMYAATCEMMCIVLAPLCYWLICRYHGIRTNRLWVMVLGLLIFWHSQRLGGVFRVGMLLVSFCMIAYVCSNLFKETKKLLLTGVSVLYLAIILPSISIGYNQYVCINYPRSGFYYLAPYRGILYIRNTTTGELYGLRDRYGLLVKPEYERIVIGNEDGSNSFCRLMKDGYTQFYHITSSEIIPSERDEKLQAELCRIMEDYASSSEAEYDYEDRAEIKVTDGLSGKVIGDVRMGTCGNPWTYYEDEFFLSNDTASIALGEYVYTDSVHIYNHVYSKTKTVLSYSENIPAEPYPRYNVTIRLTGDKRPKEKDVELIMSKVRELKFFATKDT